MKKITVDKKQVMRLKEAIRVIKIDLHLFQFRLDSYEDNKLNKQMVDEARKCLSIIDKMIGSKKNLPK